MAYALLGFYFDDEPKYPSFEPEVAVQIGWWVFALVALLALYGWFRGESLRRSLLALEDPRTFAILRIGFALMTLVCFLNMLPYWRMLWSDEGLFDLAYAQDRMGRSALRGWSPDEGFFDVWAVICFLCNKPSLFYLEGSPNFVVGYMIAFFVVLLLYAAGVASRVTGVVAWLLMNGIYDRNSLYWEGTDTVYRCAWFILLFARTGHAWSVDNWLRCRYLRRRGRLGPHLQPVYRLVPAWPRYLLMLQVCAIYVATGAVKTGSIWAQGDALYYALNMDHFYRFEDITQWVSSVFGLNLFRINTWVVLWWERLFGLIMLGEVLRFGLRHRHEDWYQRQNTRLRLWLGRVVLVAAYGVLYAVVVFAAPYCVPVDNKPNPQGVLVRVHIVFGIAIPLLVAFWFVVERIRLFPGGRDLGRLTKFRSWLRIPEVRPTQTTIRAYVLGRRTWLTIGFIFHGFLIAFMNIGMFPFIMLMTYAAFFEGEELRRTFAWGVQQLRRHSRTAWLAPAAWDRALEPAQDLDTVPDRGRPIPDLVVLAFGVMGAWLVVGKVEAFAWVTWATYGWLAAITIVAIVFRWLPPHGTRSDRGRPLPAYGAIGRAIAFGVVVWHTSAVTIELFPTYPVFNRWRSPAHGVFTTWLRTTGTSQSWRMFSPNPPRSNTFMQTVTVLPNGERWDLRNNGYHYDLAEGPPSRPDPWIINDRMRKMHRRMVGKGKWYLRYWAGFYCREWALAHDGELPREIEVNKIVTRIPAPAFVSYWVSDRHRGRKDKGTGARSGMPYDPRRLRATTHAVESHACTKVGELPPWMKARYGLPWTEADDREAERLERDRERKFVNRRESWEKRRDYGRAWAYAAEQQRRQAAAPRREAGEPTNQAAREEPDRAGVGDDDGVE